MGGSVSVDVGGIHITAAPGMSPKEIAREVLAELDSKLARQRAGAFTRTY